MKHLVILFLILFSTFSFSQNSGLIVGNVLDGEMNGNPLMDANISIKGTSTNTTSDLSGLFLLENLKDGDYTLVCSFVGYESKEAKVKITSGEPTEINITLKASTLSLNDFAALGISPQDTKQDKTVSIIN
ncbi:hypothetical protein APS56_09300 [Pseudalgibacter alginicilyticus]|uniref:TonB-dependent receptor n=1 Tax=Pseudalgibacter alginicilyticus TaxID=1736674 RepID=A0A0P0CGQ2_9FLAO|nr:carboxypeptidase-like regulatory domain-containing protein [Pseudalgibacter alginicilyticus]ALJ05307.1 hypothetical protein APS56_09300 [Pseudalgibacter alginicilyticus]